MISRPLFTGILAALATFAAAEGLTSTQPHATAAEPEAAVREIKQKLDDIDGVLSRKLPEIATAIRQAAGTFQEPLAPLKTALEAWTRALEQSLDAANANEAFKEAVRPILRDGMRQSSLNALVQVKRDLVKFVDKYPKTDLAVKLVSGQDIGNISIPAIKRRIRILNYTDDSPSRRVNAGICPNLRRPLASAIEIRDDRERDATLGWIARKQTRANSFACAWLIAREMEEARSIRLGEYIRRAQVRAASQVSRAIKR